MPILRKIHTAERNLEEAVRLFFEKRDPIAVHTLASAAQGVVRDIARSRGLDHTSILDDNPLITENNRQKWISAINAPRNFFKHADKDPEGLLDFEEEENIITLLDAAIIYSLIEGHPSHAGGVFTGWFITANPELKDAISGNTLAEFCEKFGISHNDFPWFLEALNSHVLVSKLIE